MRVYLSLGSNIEPEKNLHAALQALRARFGTLEVSSVYRTGAVGFDGPTFWNLAAGLTSDLDADALRAWLRALEDAQGRDREQPRYADRTLDIDIIAVDDRVTSRPELQHAFVLAPLAEIAPSLRDPNTGSTVGELFTQLKTSASGEITALRKLDIQL